MTDEQAFLPAGWPRRLALAAAAAAVGNGMIGWIPWPPAVRAGFERSMAPAAEHWQTFLLLTLVIAPALEELVFRRGIYGALRRRIGFWPAAAAASLAFGVYHGNWIQGIYGFCMGMLLAWGYEDSSCAKYRMAVLMHSTANLAALAVSAMLSEVHV